MRDFTDKDSFNFYTNDGNEITQEINWLIEYTKRGMTDFMLVKFLTKKTIVYYFGRVEDIDSNVEIYQIQFIKKDGKENFHF